MKKSLRALLVGYGKMGSAIEAALRSRSHSVAGRVDPYNSEYHSAIDDVARSEIDVAVDFSTAEAFMRNYVIYADHNIPVVVGTTGWYHHFEQITSYFVERNTPCVYGTNFSVGAQMFFKLISRAAELLGPLPHYDFMLTEMHHKHKIDSPSGTAKSAAQKIIEYHPRKKSIVTDPLQRAIKEQELHVASLRGGSIPGVHTLTIDSSFDTITISHSARNRNGFALGAVLAAEWIMNHSSADEGAREGVYNIEDIIEDIIQGD